MSFWKNNDEKPEKRFLVKGVMIVPYLICAGYILYAAYRYAAVEENGDYSSLFYLIHGPIHEIGHFFFSSRAFPEFLHVLAGTLFQWLAPVAAGLQFLRNREFPAAAVALGWLGLAMLDTMVYMRDASELKLQLVAPFSPGGDIIHDWNYLFDAMGLLGQSKLIAGIVGAVGWSLAGVSALWIFYMCVRGIGRSPRTGTNKRRLYGFPER